MLLYFVQEASPGKATAAGGGNSSSPGKGWAGLGSRALQPLRGLALAMRPLMQGALQRTTLLLMLIWFTNALCYYGLVLLTTSVCNSLATQTFGNITGRRVRALDILAQLSVAGAALLDAVLGLYQLR